MSQALSEILELSSKLNYSGLNCFSDDTSSRSFSFSRSSSSLLDSPVSTPSRISISGGKSVRRAGGGVVGISIGMGGGGCVGGGGNGS